MALDLQTLSPEARAAFIKDGERFSSEDTLDQANQTLNAYLAHGSKLAAFGFVPEDAAELKDGRDALIEAGVGREAKRTNKKIDTAAHAAAMRDGQGVRLRARSVLAGAKRVLFEIGAVGDVVVEEPHHVGAVGSLRGGRESEEKAGVQPVDDAAIAGRGAVVDLVDDVF